MSTTLPPTIAQHFDGRGKDVRAMNVLEPCESLSINSMDELAVVENAMRAMGMAGP